MFTDGSCLNNQNKKKKSYGGIGVFIIFPNTQEKQYTEILNTQHVTNQSAELMAVKKGLDLIDDSYNSILYLYTDSKYVINIFTNWIKKWELQSWKKMNGDDIENIDIILAIFYKIKSCKFKVIFKHVRAHQTPPDKNSDKYILWYGNNQADKLATFSSNLSKET